MTTATDVYIYVSPTGNDNNPGTRAAPLQTFGEVGAFENLVPVNVADVGRKTRRGRE
jgi:hypothetical protein